MIRFFEALQAGNAGADAAEAEPSPAPPPPGAGAGLCLGTPEECAGVAGASAPPPARTPAPVTATVRPSVVPERTPAFDLLVSFAFNSAELTGLARERLARFAEAVNSPGLAELRFVIEGHTDARGEAAFNAALSQARANAVAEFLTARGVAPSRLDPVGYGETRPRVADPFDPGNRRVESRLLPESGVERAASDPDDGAG